MSDIIKPKGMMPIIKMGNDIFTSRDKSTGEGNSFPVFDVFIGKTGFDPTNNTVRDHLGNSIGKIKNINGKLFFDKLI